MFVANMCLASLSIYIFKDSPTGTPYTLTCMEGFTASSVSGTLLCDNEGNWINNQSCSGERGRGSKKVGYGVIDTQS